jgi:phospholipase C
MHAATSVGLVHNPWEFPIEARTIYEDIDEVSGRTWAFYYYDLADANNFPALKKRTELIRPFSQFHTDLDDPESFPNYVFLCPKYWNTKEGHANSQHAPYDVRYGEHWIADVYEALRNSDIWENTLFIITYDEHGGFYDHVQPPDQGVLPPDDFVSPTAYDKTHYGYMFANGRPKPEYVFHFDRLGCRVPTVLVSPWIKKGMVVSDQLQHTSVLATVRKMWGLREQPLTKREGQAKRFDQLLEELDAPRDDCPTKLKRPPLPEISLTAAADQPLSPVQWEIFHQVNHLDGHEDSGKPAPPPKTQGEAAKYIQERTRAHRQFHRVRKGNGRFTVYQDKQDQYRWRLLNANGEIIASSGEGFATLAEAENEITRVRELASGAGLDETDI